MMPYYAISRCRTVMDQKRAIALCNDYGFGFALGANFRHNTSKCDMLFPDDLEEIVINGKTKFGS